MQDKSNQPQTIALTRFIFLPAAYSLLIIFFGYRLGISTGLEAEKYILAAKALLAGDYAPVLNKIFYSSYILFLSLCFAIGLPVKAIVVVQALLQIVASWFMFSIGKKIFADEITPLILQAIYLFAVPIQLWTITLYTESFFCFLIVCYLYFISSLPTPTNLIFALMSGLLLTLCRPPGLLIVVSSLVLLHNNFIRNKILPLKVSVVVLLLILFIAYFIFPTTPVIVSAVETGSIIGGFPQWHFSNAASAHTIAGAYQILLSNLHCSDLFLLFLKRIASILNLTRSYFSFTHILVCSPFYLFYPLAIWGLWGKKFMRREWKFFLVIAMSSLLLLTGFTFDEYNGRFVVPIFLLILFPAALSISELFARLNIFTLKNQ